MSLVSEIVTLYKRMATDLSADICDGLAKAQASLLKRLSPPAESDGQGSNSSDGAKDQTDQSTPKKADAKGS